jgi:hypothetical protein
MTAFPSAVTVGERDRDLRGSVSVAGIKDHIAFYPDRVDSMTVESIG